MLEKIIKPLKKWQVAFACIAIIASSFYLFISSDGLSQIPCSMDCGETFVALDQAQQFHRFGFTWGLIQDHATSDNISAHPYLYTHNVSIPGILFPLLASLGFQQVAHFQLITLLAYILGLLFSYLAVKRITKSDNLALIFILLMSSDYLHVLSFGLNALRAWHWLGLFGIIYYIDECFSRSQHDFLNAKRIICLCIFTFIAFGIGYDFWMICLMISIIQIYFFNFSNYKLYLKQLILLGGTFLFPFLFRQIQVIYGVGWNFWFYDFFTSVAIKVPFVSLLIQTPPTSILDKIYSENGILRAPASAVSSLDSIVNTFTNMWSYQLPVSYGLLGPNIYIFVLTIGFVLAIIGLLAHLFKKTKFKMNFLGKNKYSLGRCYQLILILTIGIAFGLFIFAPVSLHIYLKHEFPLLAALINLSRSFGIYFFMLLIYFFYKNNNKIYMTMCIFIAMIFIVDHGLVQIDNYKKQKKIDTGWVSHLDTFAKDTMAVSWIAETRDSFASNWTVGIVPGREKEVIANLKDGKPPFSISQYLLFGQRDELLNKANYEMPKYWLYFPVDQLTNFDSASPECRGNYMQRLIDQAAKKIRKAPAPQLTIAYLSPGPYAPGSDIQIDGFTAQNMKIDLKVRLNGQLIGNLNYNCIYGGINGVVTLPHLNNFSDQEIQIFNAASPEENIPLLKIPLRIAKEGNFYKLNQGLNLPNKKNQLSASQLIDELPFVPIVKRGKDWVIFDMSNFYSNAIK